MELWVRSQDKESLLKIENISIDNENWVLGNLISDDNKCICDYWKLGYYETKERALEVLDEIQEYLEKMGKDEILTDKIGIMNGIKHYGIVYKMPEE